MLKGFKRADTLQKIVRFLSSTLTKYARAGLQDTGYWNLRNQKALVLIDLRYLVCS